MSDEQALLHAIIADPDDDGPRLVYADFLEETGKPENVARAEFIRLQCEMSRPIPESRGEKLYARAQQLETKHMKAWMKQLPELDGVLWHEDFWRGFPWSISVQNFTAFRRHADTIFAIAPVQSLSCSGRELRDAKELARMPVPARLTHLILERHDLGPEDAEALADSPYLENLKHLHLSTNRIGDAGATALAASPYLRKLETLDLGHNGIGDEGVVALAKSKNFPSLEGLCLADSDIEDDGARALANPKNLPSLKAVKLWGCHWLGYEAIERLRKRFGDGVSFMD